MTRRASIQITQNSICGKRERGGQKGRPAGPIFGRDRTPP